MFLCLNYREGFPSVVYWVFLCSPNANNHHFSNSIQWARGNLAAARPLMDLLRGERYSVHIICHHTPKQVTRLKYQLQRT